MQYNGIENKEVVYDIIYGFYHSINDSISQVLDRIVFINSDILKDGMIDKLFGTTNKFGTIQIANLFIYGILIYFAFTYLLSKITNEEKENISHFFYKLLFAAIVVGFSFEICKFIIDLNNSITEEILNFGRDTLHMEINFENLFNKIKVIIGKNTDKEAESINSILEAFTSFGLINLILVYSLRYVYVKILSVLLPFAIILKSNSKTEYISKAWLKSFLGLLLIQHLVAIVVLVALSIKFGRISIFSKIVSVGCVYALMQINELQRELIGGTSLYINNSFRNYKGGI